MKKINKIVIFSILLFNLFCLWTFHFLETIQYTLTVAEHYWRQLLLEGLETQRPSVWWFGDEWTLSEYMLFYDTVVVLYVVLNLIAIIMYFSFHMIKTKRC